MTVSPGDFSLYDTTSSKLVSISSGSSDTNMEKQTSLDGDWTPNMSKSIGRKWCVHSASLRFNKNCYYPQLLHFHLRRKTPRIKTLRVLPTKFTPATNRGVNSICPTTQISSWRLTQMMDQLLYNEVVARKRNNSAQKQYRNIQRSCTVRAQTWKEAENQE